MSTKTTLPPDAIAILAGSVRRSGDRWVSTGLTEEDDTYGVPGQSLRVAAAVFLAQKYPNALLIPSGGVGYDNRDAVQPALSEVMRDELVAGGVDASRILVEKGSNSTFQQLTEIGKLAGEQDWRRVLLVTNRWHIPRVAAMLAAKFSALERVAATIAAEDILMGNESEVWGPVIEAANQSEFLRRRIAREDEGVRQIQNGTYHYR
ncbi:YdcF family protein [Candidatus Kaiserbacteria bacterium]|nr:YdcF family protein [Candidatus Kaiserbacteria bacterium]